MLTEASFKAVPSSSYGRYEVLIDQMLIRAFPSRQAALLGATGRGTVVRGVPYNVEGALWLHLDDASCQDLCVLSSDAWMLINGQSVGQILKLIPELGDTSIAALSKTARPLRQGMDRQEEADGKALSRAVRSGDTVQVVRLCSARADPNACDELGETVLFETATMGNFAMTAALLLAGCNASHRSVDGTAAADLAPQPLLVSTLRAFMGFELDRRALSRDPAYREAFGPSAHAALVRHLGRLVGMNLQSATSMLALPGEGVGTGDQPHLTLQDVQCLAAITAIAVFDWGNLLWDSQLECAQFCVAPEGGTGASSDVPGSMPGEERRLPVGKTVRLLLSASPFAGDDGQWVCIDVPDDESHLARPSFASATPWWVPWADLRLMPGVVRPAGTLEQERALEPRADKAAGSSGSSTKQPTTHRPQEEPRRMDYELARSRYQSNVYRVATVSDTCVTIDEQGRFQPGRATHGVAAVARRNGKEWREKMRGLRRRELEDKRERALALEPRRREAPPEGPEGGEELGFAQCLAARAASPEAVKGRVSVVCPTSCRRHYLHESLYRSFCMQDWPDKELIVLDTGGDPSPFFTQRAEEIDLSARRSLQPSPLDDPCVRYVHVREYGLTLGDKRNQLLQLASGEIIANFDDDNVYAPQYLTLMTGQLRASGAQLVRLASCFSWDPFSDTLQWHGEMRGRGETFVHFKGPTRIISYDQKDVGEESGFTAACVAHDVDDVFGIFVHTHHGENVSSLVQRHAAAPCGVPVRLPDVPNERLRAVLPRRQRLFLDQFGPSGPAMRWQHLADMMSVPRRH